MIYIQYIGRDENEMRKDKGVRDAIKILRIKYVIMSMRPSGLVSSTCKRA